MSVKRMINGIILHISLARSRDQKDKYRAKVANFMEFATFFVA